MMYRYGKHFTGDRELLEDTIHDLFVYLYEKRAQLPKSVDSISAYLLVSLRRRLLRNLKQKALTFSMEQLPEVEPPADRQADCDMLEREKREERARLLSELNSQLTERQRQLLYLRFREQLSYREIAIVMDITEQSAKNMMQKTLSKLRSSLVSIDVATLSVISGPLSGR
ncbi:sigma-70 family RNA polymerase sigma factor [Dysgonomonadaceae bacterium zrk40]|nr:sigma-70 family RNA polymerase sigma factor [Dysgonomonadaceae bacterium zrk40]